MLQACSAQLYHLKVPYVAAVNDEAHKSSHCLLATKSRCTWVDMQQSKVLVVHHLQYVRMARDKQLRSVVTKDAISLSVIPARIAANMFHHHIHILTPEAQHLRKLHPHKRAVNIPADASEECHLL